MVCEKAKSGTKAVFKEESGLGCFTLAHAQRKSGLPFFTWKGAKKMSKALSGPKL